ncbi:MAG TPA: 16S rRNA (cytidine(1402)-2'-O)-methyltransferase [Candidatus Binatia bacterium]|jgi:16S rRNA (cytidine1402-2'-O)-methyltransferase
MAGILYIVATPIGNLEDITLRALRILKEADLIAAEDTRHTRRLLNHYGITTPLTSYQEHNERAKAQTLVEQLEHGKRIALVSDAGTPAISDPGYRLVLAAVEAGIPVTPIPGPSAVAAVISASGLPSDRFVFEGFLPAARQERRRRLLALREEPRTLILYEAPHRLKECLHDILDLFGAREMVLARELTKLHEEFCRGSVGDILAGLDAEKTRGEMTLVVKGFNGDLTVTENDLKEQIRRLKSEGMHVKTIAEILGERYGYPKKAVYRLALDLNKSASS